MISSPWPRIALVLLTAAAGACASSGAAPRPFPRPGATGEIVRPTVPAPDDAAGATIVSTALALRGVPYRNGGADPSGFDCSGLVWYAFEQHGVMVPRTVAGQFASGRKVKERDLEPGDLVFFETEGHKASHVGLFVGAGEFVHAPSARGEVRVERLASPYWSERYVGARRY
jgi:cell wall-associated NlpC family hydrolase